MLGVSDMVNPTRAKDAAVAWARSCGIGSGPLAPSGNRWRCPPMRPDDLPTLATSPQPHREMLGKGRNPRRTWPPGREVAGR